MTNVARVIVQLTSCLLRAEARSRNVIRRTLPMRSYAVIVKRYGILRYGAVLSYAKYAAINFGDVLQVTRLSCNVLHQLFSELFVA